MNDLFSQASDAVCEKAQVSNSDYTAARRRVGEPADDVKTLEPRVRPAEVTSSAADPEEVLPEVITPEQWARILKGRRVRYLINLNDEQQRWAGKRAVSCGACTHTTMHGDPRHGWCTEHRFMVSMAFPLLCPRFAA